MANKTNSDMSADINRVIELNKVFRNSMVSQAKTLGFADMERGDDLFRIHNRFNQAIQADGQNIYKAKSPNESVYNYMANALVGYNGGASSSIVKSTGDPKRDAWLNKSKLERLFTTGDSQMASYFMASNSDIAHVYDEIDSVCAYFYQLEEAVSCIRDNVFSAEQPGTDITYDVEFPGVSDVDKIAEYTDQVKEAFKYREFNKKLKDHIGPKCIKYGTYYVIITPFSEIGMKLAYGSSTAISAATLGTRHLCESLTVSGDKDNNPEEDTKKAIMEGCEELFLSFEENTMVDNKGNKKLDPVVEARLKIIEENLDKLTVCEDNSPPNVTGVETSVYESMDPELQKMVDQAIQTQKSRVAKQYSFKSRKGVENGTITEKEINDIQGCDLRLADPRQLVPIKIFDFTLGYYYFENYEWTRMGTTLTDIMSNQLNFNQRTMIIDNIVNASLRNLKYSDLIKGDQQLRTMILNCVLYAERRDSPIRIKFVPAEYVVAYNTNTDENGNGQPVLLRSLFYGRLYTSLLLFNITAIITKSTDSEFYYLRESALDSQFMNQASDLMDQFQDNNVDLLQIAQGDILHGNRAINKRYYVNMGTSDIRPFDMEVVSGQQVDIHNDFLTDLRKMCIGSTGVPAVMVDFMDEVEYATMLGMVNIRHLRRCAIISGDMDPAITETIRKILKYNSTSIPEETLNNMRIILRKSNAINNNIMSQQINDNVSTATTMVETWLKGQDTAPPEDQAFIKEEMVRNLTMKLASSAPWEIMQEMYDKAIIRGAEKRLEQKVREERLANSTTTSEDEYGAGMSDDTGAY